MVFYKLSTLIADKEQETKEKIYLTDIAKATKISRKTLESMQKSHIEPYYASLKTLEKLIKYFNINGFDDIVGIKK